MDNPPKYTWEVAAQIESELHEMLKDPKVLHEDLSRHLELFHLAIYSVTANNFQQGIDNKADARLWDVTCTINDRFRRLLARFKSTDRKSAVEKNKIAKRYVKFIKVSQYFYKGYIQKLDDQYDGSAELRKIAHKLDYPREPREKKIKPSPEMQSAIHKAVHSTLLHLGDLSRYRNELRTEKNWNHALAYYGLAGDLMPGDGAAYNQMAMVALQDRNHLYGVYYFYRAFMVKEPHPRAKNNLELEFKKLINLWKGGAPSDKEALSTAQYNPSETAAINWLLRLHALLYKSGQIPSHDEVETEVICQTTALLKDQSLQQDILIKFAIINIAAERLALDRMIVTPNHDNTMSYFGFLRLNIRTFFMLLQVLQPEFRSDENDDLPGNSEQPERLTPVMKHILPALRHYSTWLVSQAENICENTFGEARGNRANGDMALMDNLKIYVKEMWRLYASTLCLFCTAFPPEELHDVKDVNYLLDEDAATVGFKPFTDQDIAPNCDIYYDGDGMMKSRPTDQGVVNETVENEMLSRVKTFVRDGVVIAHALKNTPIQITGGVQGVFYYVEERLPTIRPTSGHSPGRSMSSMEMKRTLSQRDEIRGYPLGMTVFPDTEFTHESVDQRMNHMVENLIGSREDTYGMNTGVANELFAQLGNGMRGGPLPRPPHWYNEQPFQSPFQSGQAAAGYTLPAMAGNGVRSHQVHPQISQDVSYLPGATNQQHLLQQAPPKKIIPDEEMDRQLQMFENPFGASRWNQKSSNIFASTPTPYKSNGQSPQELTPSGSPFQQALGHHRNSSSLAVPISSGPGIYGDSRSYERVMLQSSLSRPSGEADQMQMYTSRGRG